MLTKDQKKEIISESEQLLAENQNLLFVDFTGIPTGEINKLRRIVREIGGKFTVIKKRLLRIALKNKGFAVDPTQFEQQAGAIFLNAEIFAAAAKIYVLIKELARSKKDLKILGGVNITEKREFSAEEFMQMAKAPTRETVLTQIALLLTIPIKKVMVALQERAKTVA